jgi:hypothetical protein
MSKFTLPTTTYTIAPATAHLLEVQEIVRLWTQSPAHRDEYPPDWLLTALTSAVDAVRAQQAAPPTVGGDA